MGLGAFNLRRAMAKKAEAPKEEKAASPATEVKQDNAAPTPTEEVKTHAVGKKKKVVADDSTENN